MFMGNGVEIMLNETTKQGNKKKKKNEKRGIRSRNENQFAWNVVG